jgi:hypothetical protein
MGKILRQSRFAHSLPIPAYGHCARGAGTCAVQRTTQMCIAVQAHLSNYRLSWHRTALRSAALPVPY